MTPISPWHVVGDWFDVCKCNVPCPCTFAQAPTFGDCDGVLAYHIRQGHYGHVRLDGLNLLGVAHFVGNIWGGETKAAMGIFIDERANGNGPAVRVSTSPSTGRAGVTSLSTAFSSSPICDCTRLQTLPGISVAGLSVRWTVCQPTNRRITLQLSPSVAT